jgi:hypothetical protein
MASEEFEVTIEIHCTRLPGTQWDGRGPVHLGIQNGDEITEAAPADLERIVFRPTLRVRKHTDGSANFLGPFAHGPRAERFIYLNWVITKRGVPVAQLGRVKLHLNHITWAHVEKALARSKPVKVTIPLTNAKGKPVFASVRADACQWEL